MSSRSEELVPSSKNTEAQTQEARAAAKKRRRVQWARGTSRVRVSPPGVARTALAHSGPGDGRGEVADSIVGAGSVDVQMPILNEQQDGLEITPAMLAAVHRLGMDTRSHDGAHRTVLSLDQEGLDPEAFATLRAALERHESDPGRHDKRRQEDHGQPHRQSGKAANISALETPYSEYSGTGGSSTAQSGSLSPSSREGGHPSPPPTRRPTVIKRQRTGASVGEKTNDGDAGDNGHVTRANTYSRSNTGSNPLSSPLFKNDEVPTYIPPGEMDGLPAPLDVAPDYERRAMGLVKHHRVGLRNWFRRKHHPASSTSRYETKAEEQAIPGPTDIEKRAESGEVSTGFGFARTTFRSHQPRSQHEQSHQQSGYSSSGDEIGGTMMRGTGGVLSSLLTLYNAQHASAGGSESEMTSKATTPMSSVLDLHLLGGHEYGHREHDSRRDRRGRKDKAENQKQTTRTENGNSDKIKERDEAGHKSARRRPVFRLGGGRDDHESKEGRPHSRSLSMPGAPHPLTPTASRVRDGGGEGGHGGNASTLPIETSTPVRVSDSQNQSQAQSPSTPLKQSHRTSTASSSVDGLTRALHVKPVVEKVEDLIDARPAAARSGGGVFGALIASTGNLTGSAAPAASAIGPTVERSGYHLSRYSLDQKKLEQAQEEIESERHDHRSPSASHLVTPSRERDESQTLDELPRMQSQGAMNVGVGTPLALGQSQTSTGGQTGRPKKAALAELLEHIPPLHTPQVPWVSGHGSRASSPAPSEGSAGWMEKDYADHKDKKSAHRRRKAKRRQEEIYITMHVAEILQRQEFILKLARALMMFGAPSHRLEAQLQATARVLDINVSVIYLPNVMLLSFGDPATRTSETKFLKQGASLDLGKLLKTHMLYWRVTHDEISVTEASASLDTLMRQRPIYHGWVTVLIGGLCSSFIVPVSFNGSFVDALMCFPLGCLLVYIQNFASKNELYSNVFEITVATVSSFLSAALASTHQFCYSALASGSVVLILPGYIVLSGALELASRGIISGAVRMGYSVIYSLFLGFGLAIGGEIYSRITGQSVYNVEDYQCAYTHDPHGPWYQRTPSIWWAFLCVPMYSIFLSLRLQAPLRKELLVTVLISCSGWVANHFAAKQFVNRADITSAIGSFVVGILGNIYGRFAFGNAFVVMITGILFQVPSGLANGGLLAFASQSQSGNTNSYNTGFQTAEQLVQVAIGLTVGLFVASVVVHPFQNRRRGAGLFSL